MPGILGIVHVITDSGSMGESCTLYDRLDWNVHGRGDIITTHKPGTVPDDNVDGRMTVFEFFATAQCVYKIGFLGSH